MTNSNGKTEPIDLRFLIREPADVYHAKAKDFLSAHALNEFRRCPLLYRKKELGLVPEHDTTAYVIGRAAHTLILEGRERYQREYAVGGPINPKTGQPFGSQTKAFAEWAERQNKPVLSDGHAALVEQMAASAGSHVFARELLADGVAEGVVRDDYAGHRCQARIDWISPIDGGGIVDLKTADEIDTFELSMRAFGYLHQVAFYRALVAAVSGHVLAQTLAITVERREGDRFDRVVAYRLGDKPSVAETPPEFACPDCGKTERSRQPGSGPHEAQEVCAWCGRWLRWVPKAEAEARWAEEVPF